MISQMMPSRITPDLIPVMRQPNPAAPPLSNDDLRRDGAFDVTERLVPGPAGAPDVPLLICWPTGVTTPIAANYHAHGGGMIAGDNRLGLPKILDWAQDLGLVVVSVEYRLARRHRTQARLRIATRAWPGRRPMRARWASTPTGSSSRAAALAGDSPRRSR
jgi:acetyl esterase/lipase